MSAPDLLLASPLCPACQSPAHDQPQLHQYLNLTHIKTLIIRAEPGVDISALHPPSNSRLQGSTLAVDDLTIHPYGCRDANAGAWPPILPLLRPTAVHIHGLLLDDTANCIAPSINLGDVSGWSLCLRRLIVTNAYLTVDGDDDEHESVDFSAVGFLPGGHTEPTLEVVFELTFDPEWWTDPETAEGSEDVIWDAGRHFLGAMERFPPHGRMEVFVIRVLSKEDLKRVKEELVLDWNWPWPRKDEAWWNKQVAAGRLRFEIVGQ
jgi:hypothetical protein